ncbi:LLM class flavin-dependent oxidoreductase [Embleya sp. NBC_00896]|uniref:LLM class flavin-dependent oxidoreductase n=1 Tax=Embleya sp. NBC_00896 TaxID=2975961 RepID=UPI002F916F7C|nr:LLM class flavin-dependent oxidoreductase [Embleya sp. NBC_00896]
MSPRFHWFLPTSGDGRQVGAATTTVGSLAHSRPPTLGYLAQVAAAAEQVGFDAVLTPVGAGCPDPWIVCSALIERTRTLRFLVAFRPGFVLPTLAAQQARTFAEFSGGRLAVNIVTGGDPHEQRAYGDFLGHDDRYARTAEFLDVLRRSWAGEPFGFAGTHYRIEDGLATGSAGDEPPVYFGGASPAAEDVAARHADVYLLWGEPGPAVAQRVERVRAKAHAHGRRPRFGLRLHVIARDTAAEAWAEAHRLLDGMDPARIAAAQARFAAMESVGQARMAALHGGDARDLEVAPNLWAGIGLVREGAGTALVGSHEQVAERLAEYAALGIDEFILSGWPHLEEAYRVGERVVPLVRAATFAPVAR